MAKPVFIIDGVDYTWILGAGGIKWTRNDLDSDKTVRTLDGTMQRTRITTKRKLSISKCKRMTTAQLSQLNNALFPTFIQVTFLDAITGAPYTGTFYGSSVEATTQIYDDVADETYWENTTFSLIER